MCVADRMSLFLGNHGNLNKPNSQPLNITQSGEFAPYNNSKISKSESGNRSDKDFDLTEKRYNQSGYIRTKRVGKFD